MSVSPWIFEHESFCGRKVDCANICKNTFTFFFFVVFGGGGWGFWDKTHDKCLIGKHSKI